MKFSELREGDVVLYDPSRSWSVRPSGVPATVIDKRARNAAGQLDSHGKHVLIETPWDRRHVSAHVLRQLIKRKGK